MVGKLTTRTPANILLMRLTHATVPMMTVALHFEIERTFAFVKDSDGGFSSPCCCVSASLWTNFELWVGMGYLVGSNSMAP